ncbi:hypothetical protein [Glutamicibacter sp. NPDC087344]|uniref:hypothetical protein n=1 Tax=Glutamicibacter sp. NPDC087344 TaxID=3363994 RepID=UPI003830879E
MNDEYVKNLAYQLRWRRMPEDAVARTLREVRAQSMAARSTPLELFGPEKRYSESFAKGQAISKGFWIITFAVATSVLLILGRVITALVTSTESNPLFSILMLVAAAAIVLIGSVVGALVDHRIPKGVE